MIHSEAAADHTMGFSKNGKPCMERSAVVDALTSAKTIQAWPRSLYVFMATMSTIFPNCEKIAYRHFFNSARTSSSVIHVCYSNRLHAMFLGYF